MKRYRILTLLLSAVLLTACAGHPPRTDYQLGFDFSRLKNFTMLPATKGDNPLSADRVTTQINREMTAKGYSNYPRAPDFLVGFKIVTAEKPADSGIKLGVGAGTAGLNLGVNVSPQVKTLTQTLDIRIYDQSRKLIWRGSDNYKLSDNAKQNAKQTLSAVNDILAQFPPTLTVQ
ncbi:hypothetical protein NFHSH190041_29520 [Shewanella sp. NFH-SH190041]|uniref:DUF4136 domain-containing protein n=1 Tax=Shewanella sp. NFH-SH190041 TaxID=2950245 RepID=UPI0021C49AE0|nr:DUF4136 domain-containing protein [Shewanella sp. NFH-SH190041]BDM65500.1 hypothetical protein NFHSH190041_29520 [Shewanella sp. NFH-SH190041]